MIPNVFVSSTIRDLHHLRDSIRDTIIELSYNPILSEHGDVGYLNMMKAEESCYYSVKDCQLAVLIIGKRYGDFAPNGLSVTHNEFRAARDAKIPVLSLVEQEVLSFKRVFDESVGQGAKASFPGMDRPDKTFGLIQEIADSPYNNGILPFNSTTEAREILKKQLAHLFSALLRNRFDPLKYDIKDILSELKTLRHELIKDDNREAQLFLVATRYLVDDSRKKFRTFVEYLSGSIEKAVPQIIKSDSLEDFVNRFSAKITLTEKGVSTKTAEKSAKPYFLHLFLTDLPDPSRQDKPQEAFYFFTNEKRTIKMNRAAKHYLNDAMENLLQTLKAMKS
jgi:hypothetical protein